MRKQSLFPEAIALMKLRHKLESLFRKEGIDQIRNVEASEIIEKFIEIEMSLYKVEE